MLIIWLAGSGHFQSVGAQLNDRDSQFTEALVTAFKNADTSVKRRIISTLKDIGEPVVPLLTDALDDPSED
ncbi:MAG: HEAT repeat domain-containing protein, partial [Candidatus Latescibacteria bacterium]|nr:HEAT repeat domain-containing protein [Candidatus Latescibacterota bacterium]